MTFRITFLSFSILFLVLGYLGSIIHYKEKYKTKYSFRAMFPFEINYKSKFTDNFLGNFALILSMFSLLMFYITFNFELTSGGLIFAGIAGGIASISFFGLFFISFSKIRFHIATFVFELAFGFGSIVGTCLSSFQIYQLLDKPKLPILTMILSALGIGIIFLLAMNPKLTMEIKLNEKENSDGTISKTRPDIIPLALTEWLIGFGLYFNEILLFILMLSL